MRGFATDRKVGLYFIFCISIGAQRRRARGRVWSLNNFDFVALKSLFSGSMVSSISIGEVFLSLCESVNSFRVYFFGKRQFVQCVVLGSVDLFRTVDVLPCHVEVPWKNEIEKRRIGDDVVNAESGIGPIPQRSRIQLQADEDEGRLVLKRVCWSCRRKNLHTCARNGRQFLV